MDKLKWIPTVLPALIAIITMFQEPIQQALAAHPSIVVVVGAVYAIITHILPSPRDGDGK